jgi:secondary thiamine-phosphate synthase enzyme
MLEFRLNKFRLALEDHGFNFGELVGAIMTEWCQTTVELPRMPSGFHLITDRITTAIPALAGFQVGLMHLFLMHTSASLTINENADPNVPIDLETASNILCPENLPFLHTDEGADDMPAHVKCALFGSHLLVPIRNGKLALGTWQGIYLAEHRDRASSRTITVTMFGNKTSDK